MKKLFIFLLIFIFASPAVSHACHGCLFNQSDSSRAVIQESSPDCCAQMNVSAKGCQSTNITERATSSGPTVSFSETLTTDYFSQVAKLPKPRALSESFGSPPNLPEKPPYLINSILRI